MLASVEINPILPGLSPVAGKPLLARFDGDLLSSDGGLALTTRFFYIRPDVLCGWLPRCQVKFDILAVWSGTVFCPAC